MSSKLERATLQFEGAQTKCADLEHKNDELKRTNADVHRQLEKWQDLETKGGAEVDVQRKKRMELEVQIKDLETQLEKAKEEKETTGVKDKRKIEKLKATLAALQVLLLSSILRLS